MPLLAQAPKPRVILGLMTIGPDPSSGARITSLADYSKILDVFQQKGYNEIDTARAYVGGQQEAFTRDVGYQKRGLQIATKVYPREAGIHKPEKLREVFSTSLKELDTNCVDIFYLHAADRSVPFEETLREADKLHKEGKFVQLGLSNFTAFEVSLILNFKAVTSLHCFRLLK